VTRTDGNWVLGLDGRPALDVYREVARAPLAEDLRRALSFVLAEVPHTAGAMAERGGSVVRHLAGVSERRRAFVLAEPITRGQALSFVLRDADGARADLREMLAGVAGAPAAFGLYLGCRERGASLFGVAGLETAYLERALPGVPVLGLSGPCEIGPVGAGSGLLTHAAVLALVSG
jgi:small ligand-binding sensory domain FIST